MTDNEFFDLLIDITDVIYKECQDVPHDIGTKIGTIIGKHLNRKIFDAETFNTYSWNKDVMTDMAIESFKESDKIFFDLLIDITDVINGQFRKEKNIFVTPEEATEKCLNDYPEAQKALDEFTWRELKADEKS